MIPNSDEEWRHCIQVICRVPLTAPYVRERLQALADPMQHGTAQFLRHQQAVEKQPAGPAMDGRSDESSA
ncbi:hypothetical protein [uncultured Aquimonas sp.]|jgi:hypothetical protein|uniref:hypothetical protein n=1 Tax=uncultured Aquimonas sp. TaxID=385483 RepID=UPI00086C0949|nr:hypothetical protein [uncultured Aquimonas sp.]ODU40828.1 MAG: hypothetical protein ABS96_34020 [Xanthomonadaceae bacterium SCN 69-123]